MKLQIYSVNDRYSFAVGKFSSVHHYLLCPDINPTYQYAWEAYRDAHKMYRKQFFHIEALQKTAADDLEVTDLASEVHEVSAEEMIVTHFSKIFELTVERCKSFKDEKDKELAYGELKSAVTGLLQVKENLEVDSDKVKLDEVLNKFKKLARDKFPKLLAKDKAEMEKKENEEPIAPVAPEDMGEPPMTEPMSDQMGEGALPMAPIAANMGQFDTIMRYGMDNINDIRTEVLDEYSERICKCIEKIHPDAVCKIDYDDGVFNIAKANGGTLLKITVNKDLNLQDIEPDSELSSAFPLHSLEFYQKYWKPIVEKVGHCLSRDLGIIICPAKSTLPDIPNSFPKSVKVMGWSFKDKSEKPFEMYFGGEDPTWRIKKYTESEEDDIVTATRKVRPSKYTEEDFIQGQPRRVQCIDPNLKSILGKIGEVEQVIPLQDHIEVDVNFGRLTVRLTENQIELINEVPTNT